MIDQKGFANLLVILLLIAGIAIGVFLVFNRQIFKSKASVTSGVSGVWNIDYFKTPYSNFTDAYHCTSDIQIFNGHAILTEIPITEATFKNSSEPSFYAGQLGKFFAPPYFSAGQNCYPSDTVKGQDYYKNGFFGGLVFYNRVNSKIGYEQPTPAKDALWYPSKMVVSHQYDGSHPISGVTVTGEKVLLPNSKGFALKLTLTNNSNDPQNIDVLFANNLPTFDTIDASKFANPNNPKSWVWDRFRISTNDNITSTVDNQNGKVIAQNNDGAYLAVRMSDTPTIIHTENAPKFERKYTAPANAPLYNLAYWGPTVDYTDPKANGFKYIIDEFINMSQKTNKQSQTQPPSAGTTGTAVTPNDDVVAKGFGTTWGYVRNYSLSPGQSQSATVVYGVGSSPDEASKIVDEHYNKDVVAEADQAWQDTFANFYNQFPDLVTTNSALVTLYRNSVMTYYTNRFSSANGVSLASGNGASIAAWPWMVAASSVLAYAENPQTSIALWKPTLEKMLTLDLDSGPPVQQTTPDGFVYWNYSKPLCFAYDLVSNRAACNTGNAYFFSPYTLVEATYRYIVTQNDLEFGKKYFNKLLSLSKIGDDREEQGTEFNPLVDFGPDDANEFDWTCYVLGAGDPDAKRRCIATNGKFIGITVAPNIDRALARKRVAELGTLLYGEKSPVDAQYNDKTSRILDKINTFLWNGNWFDSYVRWDYNADKNLFYKKSDIPQKISDFYVAMPLFYTMYDNLYTDQIKMALNRKLIDESSGFLGPKGFTTLPINQKDIWGFRGDFHGPGMYSGYVGNSLIGLFKNGFKNEAFDILANRYSYLTKLPYLPQSFPAWDFNDTFDPARGTIKDVVMPQDAKSYLEGLSLAWAVIEGLFGIENSASLTSFQPHIPESVLSSGPIALKNIRSKGLVYDLDITSDKHTLKISNESPSQGKRTTLSFGYGSENGSATTLNLEVQTSLLELNSNYKVVARDIFDSTKTVETRFATDATGNGNFNLELKGVYKIEINAQAATSPAPAPISAPTSPTDPFIATCSTFTGKYEPNAQIHFWMYNTYCSLHPDSCKDNKNNGWPTAKDDYGGYFLGLVDTNTDGTYSFDVTTQALDNTNPAHHQAAKSKLLAGSPVNIIAQWVKDGNSGVLDVQTITCGAGSTTGPTKAVDLSCDTFTGRVEPNSEMHFWMYNDYCPEAKMCANNKTNGWPTAKDDWQGYFIGSIKADSSGVYTFDPRTQSATTAEPNSHLSARDKLFGGKTVDITVFKFKPGQGAVLQDVVTLQCSP